MTGWEHVTQDRVASLPSVQWFKSSSTSHFEPPLSVVLQPWFRASQALSREGITCFRGQNGLSLGAKISNTTSWAGNGTNVQSLRPWLDVKDGIILSEGMSRPILWTSLPFYFKPFIYYLFLLKFNVSPLFMCVCVTHTHRYIHIYSGQTPPISHTTPTLSLLLTPLRRTL